MDDPILFTKLQEGDQSAFRQLFLKYYSPLCEYASRFVGDAFAEEIVQELMADIWENRKLLFIESSLKSYLFTAVRHRCLNLIKKEHYHKRVENAMNKEMEEPSDDPDHYLIDELAEQIQKAINMLPDTYRHTFLLSRFEHLTHAQIAKQLGVSIKTVEYRISQSLKNLHASLKSYLEPTD
ncbi:MAG: RNA polymerase sigma-70 factor [Tannerellaceae bacterium]|jgi:RNA polymerase sigma-70 factor (ECF subfamily)|nr:RNA polymerase sigma-70 factor [Tannerellaceae bacterium]